MSLGLTNASGEERIFPYTETPIQDSMKSIGDELGWKESFSPYSLRKWFRTQLTGMTVGWSSVGVSAGQDPRIIVASRQLNDLDDMNDALIETMMGHSLGRVKKTYLVPPPQKLIKIYENHYDALKL